MAKNRQGKAKEVKAMGARRGPYGTGYPHTEPPLPFELPAEKNYFFLNNKKIFF